MQSATFEAIWRGDAKLELLEPLAWNRTDPKVRATNRLKSVLSVPITLVAQFTLVAPHRPSFLIHDGAAGRNNACRLDVRGSHLNRRTDGHAWKNETHLHLWRDDCHEAHAVNPPAPWPPDEYRDDDTQITSEQFRQLFESFCRIVHVKLGGTYTWVDPLELIAETEAAFTEDGDVIP